MTGLRERKKQQTRDLIVDHAGRLFGSNGYEATTVEDIAAACDVSVGTVYNYFGTKTAILLAHLEDEVTQMMRAGDGVLAKPPHDLASAVAALLDIYITGFAAIDRELLREVFAAGFAPSPDVLPDLIRFDELLISQLATLLVGFGDQLRPGADRADAVALFYSILGTQLIMYLSVETITARSLRRTVAQQIRLACAGVCAPEQEPQ
jgi:AcrR family transcriptional regulator